MIKWRTDRRLTKDEIIFGDITQLSVSVFVINVNCLTWRQVGKFEVTQSSERFIRARSTRSYISIEKQKQMNKVLY
jgi:hypothetical protein